MIQPLSTRLEPSPSCPEYYVKWSVPAIRGKLIKCCGNSIEPSHLERRDIAMKTATHDFQFNILYHCGCKFNTDEYSIATNHAVTLGHSLTISGSIRAVPIVAASQPIVPIADSSDPRD